MTSSNRWHDDEKPSYDEVFYPEESAGMDWPVIHTYTRRQALEDGFLIDVSEAARLFFKHPVAFTDQAFFEAISGYCRGTNTPKDTRLSFVLSFLRDAIATKKRDHSTRVYVSLPTADPEGAGYFLPLIVDCGPGDDPEPVITVMRPEDV